MESRNIVFAFPLNGKGQILLPLTALQIQSIPCYFPPDVLESGI